MTAHTPNGQHGSNDRPSQSGNIRVPPTVYSQLEALRQSGVLDMSPEVHAGLVHFGFEEARQWLEANPGMYGEGVRRGFAPTDPEAVKEIDSDELAASVPAEPSTPTRTDATTPNEQYLLNHLQSLRRFSQEAEVYYTDGSWRETRALTGDEHELAEQFDNAADCEPRQCYRNALLTAATFGRSHDLVYVEGYVKSSVTQAPIAHAWVELRGTVVEITFPDGPEPPSDAAYLGIEFPFEEAYAKILDEGIAEPLAM